DVAAAALALARADKRPVEPVEAVRERPQRDGHGHRAERTARGTDRRASHAAPRPSHEPGMVPLTLDTGYADGVRPGHVVSALAGGADIPGQALGQIRIQERYTEVDVPEE